MLEDGFNRRDVLKTTAGLSIAVSGLVPGTMVGRADETGISAGDRIWSFEADGPVETSPTVVNETIYFGSHDGNVYAADAETGEESWRFETENPPADQRYDAAAVWGEMKVLDGTMYVGAMDNHLYALDAATGEEKWRFRTDGFIWGSPAVADDTVYVPSRDHHVYAVNAETGELRWRSNVEHPAGGGATVVDGQVFVGSYGEENFHAFDATNGDLLWKKEFGKEQCSAPAVHDGTVYTIFRDEPLYAFDADTGEVEWTFDGGLIGTNFGINEVPTVWDGTVYVSNRDGLFAIDANTGEEEWSFDKGLFIHQTPTVADGVLFIGSHDETFLFAVDAETGEELWRFETYANIYASPTVVDGVVFFGSHDGYLHAVDAGVDGSGEDVLLDLGVNAHHHEWAGDPEPDLEMVHDGDTYEPFDGEFDPPYGDWFQNVPNYEGTVDMRGQSSVTIEVGAGPEGYEFDPPAVLVDPGIDIAFEWTGEGGAHDVVEETGLWESELVDERGHTFELYWDTLETGDTSLGTHGVHRYYCTPHRDQGMKGAIAVGEAAEEIDDLRSAGLQVPGLVLGAGAAGVGAAAYALKRWAGDGDEQ